MFTQKTTIFKTAAALLLIASSPAFADSLPDPMTCGQEFQKVLSIRHMTPNVIGKRATYTMTLDLAKLGAVTYASNWGRDIYTETVDGKTMMNSGKARGLTYVLTQTQNYNCANAKMSESCFRSVMNVLQQFKVAQEGLIDDGNSDVAALALQCATSITLSFAYETMVIGDGLATSKKNLERQAHVLRAVTQDQISTLNSRMIALQAKDDADFATTMTLINMSSSSSK